jgi:hypothetical protein
MEVRATTQYDARQLIELQYGRGRILFGPEPGRFDPIGLRPADGRSTPRTGTATRTRRPRCHKSLSESRGHGFRRDPPVDPGHLFPRHVAGSISADHPDIHRGLAPGAVTS